MKTFESIFFLLLLLSLNLYAQPTTANQDFYVTNGNVYAIAVDGDYTYIGGVFSYVGMNTGYGIKLTASSAVPSKTYPKVNGTIYCVEPDGSGGWYIGGSFSKVGSYTRNQIAHINSDGSVNTTWNPNANSTVYSIKKDGNNIYVGGNFTTIGGQTRKAIAKLNNTDGNADASWNANLDNANPIVYTIAITGSDIYIGGNFTSINSTTVNKIAKLNISDGSRNSSWDANANNNVKKLLISTSYLFVIGDFTTIGGQSRSKIAKLNTTDGNAETWNANQNSSVYDMALSSDGGALYVGGTFTSIGGESRTRLAKIGVINPLVDATWQPYPNHDVYSIAVTSSAVYVGGNFTNISSSQGVDVYRFAKLNTSNGDAVSTWLPTPNTYSNAIAISGDDIYAGGSFSSAGGKFQSYIARINNTTGKLDENWSPIGVGVVYTIDLGTTYIYLGGDSFAKRYIRSNAALDGTWTPSFDNIVRTIYPDESNDAIYLGGDFTSVNSTARNYVAKVNNSTGATDITWDPNASNRVRSLIVSSGSVYAGGEFTTIGGQSRNYIAHLNTTNGNANDLNPNANNYVYDLALNASKLYIGGGFTVIGGQTRNRLAKYDLSSGSLDETWNPNSDGWIYTLVTNSSGSSVYVGGNFFVIGGSNSIYYLAKLNNTNGNTESWDVNCGYLVHSVVSSGDDLYAGGEFNAMNEDLQPRIALFTTRALPVEIVAFTAKLENRVIKLNWQTATEVNNYGFEIERSVAQISNLCYNWETIGFVEGHGNSNSPKDYSFVDSKTSEVFKNLGGLDGELQYRLKQLDFNGNYEYSNVIEIKLTEIVKEYKLEQNYPNPFNPTTTIKYSIPNNVKNEMSNVKLIVYDILGSEVATLVNEKKSAGNYEVKFNASNLASGVYIYKLQSGEFAKTKKFVLMK
ncbi:MAG: T9SS type A sorting domain-containing protein [Bacteroidetes bacterium]|nr:T9SS type A sorting domain-containing protein [Bacteroidota bacterium]MBU1799033.1 T9SS type A sorting domain-containing protein [Bacteroidota bacterium]